MVNSLDIFSVALPTQVAGRGPVPPELANKNLQPPSRLSPTAALLAGLLALRLGGGQAPSPPLILLVFSLLPGAQACQSCPGVPFLQPEHMATVAGALLSFATINARGSLFAANATSLKDIAAAMLRHEIHAVSVTETNSFAIHDAAAHWRREKTHSERLEKKHGIKVISASTRSAIGRTAILLHESLAQYLPPTPTINSAVDGRYL